MTTAVQNIILISFAMFVAISGFSQGESKDSLLNEIKVQSKILEDQIFYSNLFAADSSSLRQFAKSLDAEFTYSNDFGTISDYFGTDSSNFLVRNSLSGTLKKSIGPMDASLSFGVRDLKNRFGRNNYFTFEFVPSVNPAAAGGVSELDLKNKIHGRFKDSLSALDSRLGDLELDLDAKIDQGYRQLDELRQEHARIEKSTLDPALNLELEKVERNIETLEKTLRLLGTSKSQIRSSRDNLELMRSKLDMDYLESLKEIKDSKGDIKSDKFSLDRLQVGRSGYNLPTPGTMSTPINGVSLSFSNERWFFDQSIGVTQNNLFAINPIDSLLLEGNSSNFFKQLRNYSTRPIVSSLIGYGKRVGDHLGFESSYIGEDISNKSGDQQIVNRIKYRKNLPFNIKFFGSVAHNQMLNDLGGNELEKMSHTIGLGLNMRKTRTQINIENQTVGRNVDLSGLGFSANDFNYSNLVITQRLSKRVQLVFGFDNFVDNLSSKLLVTTKIKNYLPKLILRPIENLNVSIGGIFNEVSQFDIIGSRSTMNVSWDATASYSFELAEHKSKVQVGYVKNTIYNFSSLFVLERFVSKSEIGLTENTDLGLTFNELNQDFGEKSGGMHSRISTVSLTHSLKKMMVTLEGSYSKDLRGGNQDLGGSLSLMAQLGETMNLEMKLQRHVLGSYVSMFQPKRFAFNPYEGRISLTKKI